MELKQRIIRNLECANKRLKLQGKELDETQLEIIEFCLLHDLQQCNIANVSQQRELFVAIIDKMTEQDWKECDNGFAVRVFDRISKNCG